MSFDCSNEQPSAQDLVVCLSSCVSGSETGTKTRDFKGAAGDKCCENAGVGRVLGKRSAGDPLMDVVQ